MSVQLSRPSIKWVSGLVAAACIGLATPPASAQFGEAAGIAEMMVPEYLSRDVVLFSEGLKLDEAQRVILEALYSEYEQSFEDAMDRMKQNFNNMRDQLNTSDQARVLKIVFEPIQRLADEKAVLGAQFIENVKVILTAQQLEMWPAFERRLFREKQIGRGTLSGESLNLFNIIRGMNLDPKTMQAIQPELDAYDLALDQALRRRLNTIMGPQRDMFRALAEQNNEASMLLYDQQMQAKIGVRQVNDEFIERIASIMPAGVSGDFRQAALERAYSRIYRPTPVQRMFSVAKEFDDLESGARQAVVQLEAEFLVKLEALNKSILSALREQEPLDSRARAMSFARRQAGQAMEKPADLTRDLFVQRDQLSRDYAKQLQAVLTPEQFSKLPGGQRWTSSPEEEGEVNGGALASPPQRHRPAKSVDQATPTISPN